MNQQITYSRCPSCYSPLLQYVGAQLVCLSCNYQPSNLQHETRVVPEQYESNSKNAKQLEKERRLNALIKEFSQKHRQFKTSEQMAHFRDKLKALKMATERKKGSREAAAVVVYCEMQEDIKMNIKQYCRYNNLNIKIFHQKYKAFHQMPQTPIDLLPKLAQLPQEPLPLLKIEEKMQESNTTEKLSERSDEEESELMSNSYQGQKQVVQGVNHAIQLIYDEIFKKYIYKQKRAQVISGLVKKIEQIQSQKLQQIKYNENKPFKLYYIIFAIVKSLGHKISFADFSQAIKSKTGFILKRKTASQIKRLYENKDTNCKSKRSGQQDMIKMQVFEDDKERVDISDSQISFI